MTPEISDKLEEFDDDINTTAPQENPAVAWTMPVPVFRKTSGRLPKDFAKRDGAPGNIAEPLQQASTSLNPDPRPKSPTLKIVVIALAVVAMIAFLVVFLSVVYIFFLARFFAQE